MRIKQLEIDNFKSFRTKTTIPFLEGFTTISGPNGSGKSNIIDCILFALGLSTSRTMRAEKLTDLINNNNQRREASVTISFTDDDNDNAEFEIRRKIKEGPNGYTSTYYLNGHVSTLSEIHRKLSNYNVSPGCYNVMMQGDVTGIINMSPTERRKIIDEIAGVAEFDRRIEQAENEILTVNDRIDRSNIILGEIDTRLEQLSTEREHALKYKKLKDEKQELVNQVSLAKYAEVKKSQSMLNENINECNKEKTNNELELTKLQNQIIEIKNLVDELNEKVKIKGEDEQISYTKQAETLKGEIFRQEQGIEFKLKQIEENSSTSQKATKEINNLNESIDDIKLKIENKEEQYNLIENQIKKENEELNRLINESSNLTKTAQDFIQKRNELRKKLERAEDEHGRLNRENLKWQDIINRLKDEYTETESQLSSYEENKSELISKKSTIEKELTYLTEEKSGCEIQLSKTINDIKSLKAEIDLVEDKIRKYSRQLMQLEANKKAADEFNFNKAVKAVLASGIHGIHKTLAQLGKVDKEYATALEIAMGNRMNCIVVDNEDVATQAINYLKQCNAGRGTFLPLNKLRYYLSSNKLPNHNGVIGFAINLVQFDSVYKNAFYYALGDTLVVESIEVAKPLMGEFRMVTLDGSLIEKTGAMTGGSIAKSNLKFGNTEDNHETDEITNILKELELERDELLDRLDELEKKMERCRKDYSDYLNKIHQKKLELDNFDNSLKKLESEFEHKQVRAKEIGPKLEEADLEQASIEDELLETNRQIDLYRQEIQITDSNIPTEKIEEIEKLTGNIEFEIKNWESKLRNIEADIKKITMERDFKLQSLEYQQEKIQQCKTENTKMEEEITHTKASIATIQEKVNQLNEKIALLSEELKEIQKERDQAAKNLFKMQESEEKAKYNIQKAEETLSAYNERRKSLNHQLAELKTELREMNIDYSRATEITATVDEISKSVEKLTKRMEALEPVNMLAIKEYDEVNDRKEELNLRISTLSKEKDDIQNRLNSYEDLKKESFMTTFENVSANFKEIFSNLSDGIGNLALENPDDIFTGGLIIEAQPRGKKLLRLEAMSGGEKSLTALAFVFAFQRYLPAPFYAFDEVDMHLDGLNVEKLAQMIREQASNTQFIVVSLRKPMIERADRTVGVTQRNDGISKVTGVKLNDQ